MLLARRENWSLTFSLESNTVCVGPPRRGDGAGLGAELSGVALWCLTHGLVFLLKFLTLRYWC